MLRWANTKEGPALVPILSASLLTQHAFSFSVVKSPLRISTLVAVSRVKRAPGVFDFRKTRTVIATGGGGVVVMVVALLRGLRLARSWIGGT